MSCAYFFSSVDKFSSVKCNMYSIDKNCNDLVLIIKFILHYHQLKKRQQENRVRFSKRPLKKEKIPKAYICRFRFRKKKKNDFFRACHTKTKNRLTNRKEAGVFHTPVGHYNFSRPLM